MNPPDAEGRAAGSAAPGKVSASGSSPSAVRRFADAHPEFSKPFGFVLAVNDATLETEKLSDVAAVVADVLPGGLGVLPYQCLTSGGLLKGK